MIAALLASAALLADTRPTAPIELTIAGVGGETCAVWKADQEKGELTQKRLISLSWVLGYLTARNTVKARGQEKDYLASVDYSAVGAWMDKYCSAHPDDLVVTAAANLQKDLEHRP